MEEQREDVDGPEQGRKMLLVMAKIVFEMVALGLESVVVLILNFPTSPPGPNHLGYILIAERIIRGQGVVIGYLAISGGDSKFAPVNQQGLIAIFEGDSVEIAVGIGFLDLTSPLLGREGREFDAL